MKICPKCSCANWTDVTSCIKCDSSLIDAKIYFVADNMDSNLSTKKGVGRYQDSKTQGHGAISTLRCFAWLNLIIGIIGSMVLYNVLGVAEKYSSYSTETNPFGIILTLAWLIEGVFGCAFLLVICSMAENLIAIRENTEKNKVSSKTDLHH